MVTPEIEIRDPFVLGFLVYLLFFNSISVIYGLR